MKLQDIEQLLNGQNESTHILYDTTLDELKGFQKVLGGTIEERYMYGGFHTYEVSNRKINIVIHTITKHLFK